ncbi:MAG TPA: hypothetical protein VJR05_12255 [Acidimicrobiia bacterium]|nr:hypothetical protein [Acidimicrobiia bacterium]
MPVDLDTRARRAALAIHTAVEAAQPRLLHRAKTLRKRLRLVSALAVLLAGSAVGLALVTEPFPGPQSTTSVPPTAIVPRMSTTMPPTTTTAPLAAPTPPTTDTTQPDTTQPDTTPPSLVITHPEDGSETSERVIEFVGTTDPGATVQSGRYQAEVDPSGVWRLVLVLSEGWNTARFTAQDEAGNLSQASVRVRYLPVEATTTTESPTTTTESKELAPFEAYPTFGACAEDPPFDIYYGTGHPGSTVRVDSEYGSGETLVDPSGAWELKVFFEGMTPGQTIVVKASDQYGRKHLFEFTYQP